MPPIPQAALPLETFRCYGQWERPAELIPLRAGPLEMGLDPTTGFVRRISCEGHEVLRGIYAAVRDHNWGTVAPVLRFAKRQVGADSFHLEFDCDHRRGEIDFSWHGTLVGGADGTLRYELDGAARSTFRKNRIGFCVLHPRACAGATARQLRIDGTELDGHFPDLIEPQIFGQSSFRQLRGIRHEIYPGCAAQVDFEGDIFEMEDQRNWTDASFKTYSTPLADPFPVTLEAGQRIRQQVTLRLRRTGDAARPGPALTADQDCLELALPNTASGTLPGLGLGIASSGNPLTEAEAGRLRGLRLAHIRVDIRLAAPSATAVLDRGLTEAKLLGVPLELAVHLPATGKADPGVIRHLLQQGRAPVARLLALREGEPATSADTLAWVRANLGGHGVDVGVGSDGNFCELNHGHALGRLGLAGADFVFWSVNPQVHAGDHLSVMETLEAQPDTARTMRIRAGGRPLVVSPVTLRQRFNPVATGAEIGLPVGELPATVDPRQLSRFAAAWTLGSMAAWFSMQVESVTYYETTGWRGVLEGEVGSSLPEKFPSSPGELFPLFHVFASLAGFRRAAVVRAGREDEVVALALFGPLGLQRVLLANLTDRIRRVQLTGWGGPAVHELRPYDVVRIDAGAPGSNRQPPAGKN